MEIKKQQFPQLRDGLVIAFSDYDSEGMPQWLIHDAGRNKFFLVGWLEYEMFERWHMGNPEAIIQSINENTTLHADNTDIDNFAQFLTRNYLVKLSGYAIHQQAKEQQLFKSDHWVQWLIDNYLFFRIPLLHPDAFLTKTKRVSDFLFSRYTLYAMILLAMVALYQLSAQWERFTHTFASVFSFQGLLYSMAAFLICKFCHELGHAYMCKRYDIPVPTLGLAFLVFWPVLYTDTTLSWSLNSYERMRIALAGIWVETYICILAALIWCNTDNQTLQTICYVTITVNWMASMIINVSPFMRFDGYYVLADYLKMPNLQPRAFALTRWQIRSWLFGWQDPPPERFSKRRHAILVAYSLFTWAYRLTVYLGIAVLVYHFFAKVVGIILFIIELYYFTFAPIHREVEYWIASREKFSLNLRTKITLTVSALAIFIFFIPLSTTIKLPATLSYNHQFLTAPEASILQSSLPAVGDHFVANQPIIKLSSPAVDQALLEAQLEYDKTISQLRRSAVNPAYIEQQSVLMSDLKRLRSEYQKLLRVKEKLIISAPFDGVVAEIASELSPGTYIMKNQWLGDIINPASLLIEAYVLQIDINSIEVGETGDFYPFNFSVSSIPVKVLSVEAINSAELDCRYSSALKEDKNKTKVIDTPCYNASELGGGIPTFQTDEGNYVPTTAAYRVLLSTDAKVNFHYVERGTVFITTKPRSYASRLFYSIKSILIEELGF